GAGHRRFPVQAKEGRDPERQQRLEAVERRTADEDADSQGERDPRWGLVQVQDGAEPAREAARGGAHARGRHRPTPSRTATIARTQAAWIRMSTASRGVASLRMRAERPSVDARQKISSTLCVLVSPSASKRWSM